MRLSMCQVSNIRLQPSPREDIGATRSWQVARSWSGLLEHRDKNRDQTRLMQELASSLAFGRPVLMNTFRAVVVEAIVERGLSDRWRHCSADYSAWDFERDDGVKLELKQSAARQSWAEEGAKPSAGVFDIKERTGRYDGTRWISGQRRWADIYIFARHPRIDPGADHRDPFQWDFYILPASVLPAQASLSLGRIEALTRAQSFTTFGDIVDVVANDLMRHGTRVDR